MEQLIQLLHKFWQKSKAGFIFTGLVIAGIITYGISTASNNRKPESPESKFISEMLDEHRAIDNAVEKAVKLQLKFPSEADFDRNEGYSVVDLSRNKGGVRGNVTTKNGFGVKTNVWYEALFYLNNGNVEVDKVNVTE